MGTVSINYWNYQQAKLRTQDLLHKEESRRALVQNATLLKTILLQHQYLESLNVKESQDRSSIKQDLSKIQHEKKLLESKISQLTTEVDTWKRRLSNQSTLQKENLTLKNQSSKLNSQLNESKNENNKIKQQFMTQKAILESKLENSKKTIKLLKDSQKSNSSIPKNSVNTSPTKILVKPTLVSPIKPFEKNPILKKSIVSNFSVSPFLHKLSSKSPTKQTQNDAIDSSTPVNNSKNQNILAESTPGFNNSSSPTKHLESRNQRSSGLKNLLSPVKNQEIPSEKSKKKASLFDVDEDDDEVDLFDTSIKKHKPSTVKEDQIKPTEAATTNTQPNEDKTTIKRRKRKIGGKAIVEATEEDEEPIERFSPLKKVKLLDKLGGISPLKQRNRERNLFKV